VLNQIRFSLKFSLSGSSSVQSMAVLPGSIKAYVSLHLPPLLAQSIPGTPFPLSYYFLFHKDQRSLEQRSLHLKRRPHSPLHMKYHCWFVFKCLSVSVSTVCTPSSCLLNVFSLIDNAKSEMSLQLVYCEINEGMIIVRNENVTVGLGWTQMHDSGDR